ncbi:ABC transporter ATP-binding protein [Hymenobacter caeli]|uniref:Lipopolysaccharide transport system ATP-binding protein n=1 Tax=Hymenobacter caeli TaxID=2735894 RepID=A0ABX2FJH7_9BACT|nr:ABC transporter ATP-binding protein [Hymenobacter caeli]NRT17262.1 lipopolysaccharide transport system ATP-binding protein [Hymenobacter caeli]
MSDVAIKVENLGKQYRLGEIGTGTLSQDLNRSWARLRGKEDPFAKIGETNDRTKKGESDFVWSLKDVNFEVKQGEVLGIIGRNGAGKSTLLKILSKVTAPTTGNVKVRGRIASLLEVGTGFHPELTGRENIFLNGAILGMTKTEIRKKFDEIVDFSGVERYIDTPVKRYSSGMYVRLAFAVAAFLEPEILIVDEVLAVGDAEFQKKCLGRMKDVSVNDGRTVLFVSHNMAAVRNLCNKSLYLKNGNTQKIGTVDDCLLSYYNDFEKGHKGILSTRTDRIGNGRIKITDFYIENFEGEKIEVINSGIGYSFVIEFSNNEFPHNLAEVVASIALVDEKDQTVLLVRSNFTNQNLLIDSNKGKINCIIKDFSLTAGTYKVVLFLGYGETEIYDLIDNACELTVEGGDFFNTGSIGLPSHCKILTRANWNVYEKLY